MLAVVVCLCGLAVAGLGFLLGCWWRQEKYVKQMDSTRERLRQAERDLAELLYLRKYLTRLNSKKEGVEWKVVIRLPVTKP